MNERIRLLAEQATKQVTKPDGHYIVQEWQRVFAELIVRECSLFVFKQNGPKSALNLLEHFGVAE